MYPDNLKKNRRAYSGAIALSADCSSRDLALIALAAHVILGGSSRRVADKLGAQIEDGVVRSER